MHIPVLLKEVIDLLSPQSNENFIDCTLGFAGHAKEILERNRPKGRILGIEWDIEKIKNQELRIKNQERIIVVNDSYTNLKNIIEREKFHPINGILLDLGMSSWDLEQSGRGFTFQKDEPLIMSYVYNKSEILNSKFETNSKFKIQNSKQENLTAREILNYWSEEEIARILKEYGQERFAKNIARKIVEIRRQHFIETTFQLVEVIRKSFPRGYKFGKQHFATKTFQALRIAVNDELGNLRNVLPQAVEMIVKGGRLVIISFHSLEDRIIKNFLKEELVKNNIKILTKKPVIASAIEIANNPRARSAKLRAVLKL
ncbi:16S rRNA (cytosine(1402)-N(4))-methyltransferase [bacterium (Candidatus Gribaldobacteria) CG08_land_8_20_14_0_20_39_15]|uniref:Ribosomal RNA small subunit methyltransferase H n=1 Tax=bacterium (Candidatus Gribaldobacteria) CG08_land_8_20_14_0_20_39_15 TaxID=2014273 RepID=A0A2M6XTW9_9BACT|nr:MAG: 16S rRNA (cytosine(1402)-N(4))-methyltransferase [bacterium (Candidatus Gribaldobacteria) CG08_land_8_20_14_0_20_39_15]